MKYLGIDYGTKRIGVALSDDEGIMAYPHMVMETKESCCHDIIEIVDRKNVGEIVIGHSRKTDGSDNDLMGDIQDFVAQLSLLVPIPIHVEPEDFTSLEAARLPGYDGHTKRNQANKKAQTKGKKDPIDDSAAALILQRFLDKKN